MKYHYQKKQLRIKVRELLLVALIIALIFFANYVATAFMKLAYITSKLLGV